MLTVCALSARAVGGSRLADGPKRQKVGLTVPIGRRLNQLRGYDAGGLLRQVIGLGRAIGSVVDEEGLTGLNERQS